MSRFHDSAVRTAIRRLATGKVDDSGTQQFVDTTGYEGDAPDGVVRVQSHGFSSHPPKGSEGLALALGGRSDRIYLLGAEHKDHRPQNLGEGDIALYNAASVLLKTKGDDLTLDAKGTATVTLKSLVIKCGGVTLTLSGDGLAISGGKVTHDGHDIGATHEHTNTQPGAGLTGPPQ